MHLVRLKPYNPKIGNNLRRFGYAGIFFHADRGWYQVEDHIAYHLATVRQDSTNPNAPLAFDVCRPEEAQRIDAVEEDAARVKRTSFDPVITTRDVAPPSHLAPLAPVPAPPPPSMALPPPQALESAPSPRGRRR